MKGLNHIKLSSILFNNTQKFYVPEKTYEDYDNSMLVLSANRNLNSYGYTLSNNMIEKLSKYSDEDITSVYKDLISCIKQYIGDDYNKIELFYPNFPEEVMEKSDEELYLNSLLYYIFSQTDDERMKNIALIIRDAVTEDKKDRLPLIEKFPRKLKVINAAKEHDLSELISDKIHAPKGMNDEDVNAFITYICYEKSADNIKNVLSPDKKFESKENLVKTALVMHKLDADNEMSKLLTDAKDVVRFAAALSNIHFKELNENAPAVNNIELAVKKTYSNKTGKVQFKLNKNEQRFIKNMLNNCKNLYYDIWKDEAIFKRLMNRIDAKRGPERVVKAFDNLASGNKTDEKGRPVISIPRQFEEAVNALITAENTKDYYDIYNNLEKLAGNYPGYFNSQYIHFLDVAGKADKAIVFIDISYLIKHCGNVPVQDLLKTYNALELRTQTDKDVRVFKNKAQKILVAENKPLSLTKDQIRTAKLHIKETLLAATKDTKKLGAVYIDPELENKKIPLRDLRNASPGNIIPPYSVIPCMKEKNLLAAAIYWKNHTDENGRSVRSDIDLGVSFYDKDRNLIDTVNYCDLRNEYAVHSGDYTDAPNGATEMLLLDKELMKQNSIKYAVFNVRGFSVPFDKAEGLKFMFMEKEGCFNNVPKPDKLLHAEIDKDSWYGLEPDKERKVIFMGKPFEPSQIEYPIKINAPATSATPCIYDVEENKIHWIDHTGLLNLCSNVQDKDAQYMISGELEYAYNNAIPNMKQLFEIWGNSCGEITDDITKADTIFSVLPLDSKECGLKETAKVISSFELDYISNEFCGKPIQPEVIEKEKEFVQTEEEELYRIEKQNKNSYDEKYNISTDEITHNSINEKNSKEKNKNRIEFDDDFCL